MIARSDESSKKVRTGQQVLEEIILNTERHLAEKLGNSERLEKWRKAKVYGAARREWLDGLRCFAQKVGIGSLYDIRAGVQQTLEPMKAFTLMMLRLDAKPEVTLRNQAAVIYAAAREGDIDFFHAIHLAFESRDRDRRVEAEVERSFLAYNILLYWFAGLLWLMSEKPGWVALCEYTKRKDITKAAYRMACCRLGLKGYKDRMRSPPYLGYDPKTGIYKESCEVNTSGFTFVHLKN